MTLHAWKCIGFSTVVHNWLSIHIWKPLWNKMPKWEKKLRPNTTNLSLKFCLAFSSPAKNKLFWPILQLTPHLFWIAHKEKNLTNIQENCRVEIILDVLQKGWKAGMDRLMNFPGGSKSTEDDTCNVNTMKRDLMQPGTGSQNWCENNFYCSFKYRSFWFWFHCLRLCDGRKSEHWKKQLMRHIFPNATFLLLFVLGWLEFRVLE